MTLPVFPSLPGQGIAVKKTPRFDTRVAMHASGREGRARSFLNPLWDFELVFEGLASDDTTYVGLGEQTMQTLAAFFMACQGQALPFLYLDPTDFRRDGAPDRRRRRDEQDLHAHALARGMVERAGRMRDLGDGGLLQRRGAERRLDLSDGEQRQDADRPGRGRGRDG